MITNDTPRLLLWLYALPSWLAELIVFAGWLTIIVLICWAADKLSVKLREEKEWDVFNTRSGKSTPKKAKRE